MIKKVAAFLLTVVLIINFTACLNPVSIDNCGYVVAIGADKGEEKTYLVTLELQRESAGTDQENNGGAVILTIEAENLPQAVSKLSSSIAYSLNFTRTHIFVFGAKIAELGLINEFLKIALDVFRIRESALMLIAEDKAIDYIAGLAADDSANIAKLQDHLISNNNTTGKLAAINVARYFEAINGGRFDPVLPLGISDESIITDKKQNDNASKGENPLKDAENKNRTGGMQSITEGAALFNGGCMTERLSPYETQLLNIGRGDFKQGVIDFELKSGGTASIFFALKRRKVRIDIGSDMPSAEIKLELNATIEFDPSEKLAATWDEETRAALETFLETELLRVFEKCIAAGSDAMGFGREASMKFSYTSEWELYDWKSKYACLSAVFKVDLILDDRYMSKSK